MIAVVTIAGIFIVPQVIGEPGSSVASNNNSSSNPVDRVIKILQPQATKPEKVPQEELVAHALASINSDRKKFGLDPVQLDSGNQAAQLHAEDVFKEKQISHWTTDGEKPYMTYTRLGGEGSVQQNVAIAGFGPDEYNRCVSTVILCEHIDPVSTIDELEKEMMYNDKECCDNGHRENILDKNHTYVSIGIAYDQYYLAMVQNFETDYGLVTDVDGTTVSITGPMPAGAKFDNVVVYYDELPSKQVYDANKEKLSYDAGTLAATVFEPLPRSLRYQQPGDYVVIEADRWHHGGDSNLDISFDLAPAIKKDGVYTVYVMFEDADGEEFSATSHSIFIEKSDQGDNSNNNDGDAGDNGSNNDN
ncbi:MAG TPA: CAP domain-containing protein [Nitrososphaera sp.]|nr:CAP domain-containing protein [Nitrososphaera sp.]